MPKNLKGDDHMNKNLYNKILEAGRITPEIKKEHFAGMEVKEIRNTLEELGLDRHIPIELMSTEIALLTPFGVLMQIRPTDHDKLGMWGGVLNYGEEPASGAVRELREETGIVIEESQLEFKELDEHFHEYANGDKALFKAYRYVVRFDYVPKVVTDEESVGAVMVAHIILEHQQKFIGEVLEELNN